jgi:hypothetical protein
VDGEPMKGPYFYKPHGGMGYSIWSADGQHKIADIRGWGWLTGTGGLNLPEAEAVAIQDATGYLLAASWEMRQALEADNAYDRHRADCTYCRPGMLCGAGGKLKMSAFHLRQTALAKAKGEGNGF